MRNAHGTGSTQKWTLAGFTWSFKVPQKLILFRATLCADEFASTVLYVMESTSVKCAGLRPRHRVPREVLLSPPEDFEVGADDAIVLIANDRKNTSAWHLQCHTSP